MQGVHCFPSFPTLNLPTFKAAALAVDRQNLGAKVRKIFILLLLTWSLAGCGYNTLQASDEQVKAGWSEVVNQYQRRADLVPNLVNTVKGYAAHEQAVLTQVTQA